VDLINPLYKTADIFISEVKMNTEVGFFPTLFSKANSLSTFIFANEIREQSSMTDLPLSQRKIADFYFRKSQTKYDYERTLGDFLFIISSVAGSWGTSFICFMLFFQTYNGNYFIISLSNKLYNYPSQRKKIKDETKIQIPKNFSERSLNEKTGISQKMIDKILIFLSYSEKLKISFWKMMKLIMKNMIGLFKCEDEEKLILFKKSEENLLHELDIYNILKKMQEFDKVKELLFTSDQQIVFGFTPKPEILSSLQAKKNKLSTTLRMFSDTLKSHDERYLSDHIVYNTLLSFENLIYSWKALKTTKHEKLLMNEHLMNMFGNDIRKIVDVPEEEFKYIIRREFNSSNILNTWMPEEDNPNMESSLHLGKNYNLKSREKINNERKNSEDNFIIDNESLQNHSSKTEGIVYSNQNRKKQKIILSSIEELNDSPGKARSIQIKNYHEHEESNIGNVEKAFDEVLKPDIKESKKENDLQLGKLDEKLYKSLLEINKNIGSICNFELDEK